MQVLKVHEYGCRKSYNTHNWKAIRGEANVDLDASESDDDSYEEPDNLGALIDEAIKDYDL